MDIYSRFESGVFVRPDDIDLNNHLHFAKYLDYVLAARYDQMERCYGMSMNEFLTLGFNCVVKSVTIENKRVVVLADKTVRVRTWIEEIYKSSVRVGFEIYKRSNGKLAANGTFEYLMIDNASGKVAHIPDAIIKKYSV